MKRTLAVLTIIGGVLITNPNYTVTRGAPGSTIVQGVDSSGNYRSSTVTKDGTGGYIVYEQPTLQAPENTGPFNALKYMKDNQLSDDE